MISSREEFDMWLACTYASGADGRAKDAMWDSWEAARRPSLNTYKNEIVNLARYSGVLTEQYANGIREIAPASLVSATDNLSKAFSGNPSVGELKVIMRKFNDELYAAVAPNENEVQK